jgi:Flp pilus assembly protein CpaB
LSRRIVIGIIIAIVGIAIAAVGVYVLSGMVRQSVAPLPQPTAQPQITENVVATTHNIALGTVLSSGDLKLVEVPVELVPPGTLNNVELAIGQFAKVDLVTGELVGNHHLADPTNVTHDVAFIIDDSQVLMAFPANDLISSVSVIQRGDIVDVFATLNQEVPIVEEGPEGLVASEEGGEEQTETLDITWDAMQRLEITALVADVTMEEQGGSSIPVVGGEGEQQAQPTPQPKEIKIQAYLLALDPQDALVLKHLKDIGAKFDLVLRSPTSKDLFELSPVNSQYLMDRYGFELLK